MTRPDQISFLVVFCLWGFFWGGGTGFCLCLYFFRMPGSSLFCTGFLSLWGTGFSLWWFLLFWKAAMLTTIPPTRFSCFEAQAVWASVVVVPGL